MELETAPEGLLTVGLVSRRSGLTTKALRHYDRIGLLRPAAVDTATGYRFYRPEQLTEARLVRLLRSVELPLDQVGEAVEVWKTGGAGGGSGSGGCDGEGESGRDVGGGDDRALLDHILTVHRRRLDARVTRLRGAMHRIDHLLKEGIETHMSEQNAAMDAAGAEGGTDSGTGTGTGAEAASTASDAVGASTDSATTAGVAGAPDGVTTMSAPGTGSVSNERMLAAQLFNEAWRLMEQEDRSVLDDDRMLHAAHASRFHWGQVAEATPNHLGRGEWQISRVYAVLGRAEPALHHAVRVLDICREHKIGDFELAFAYEALARAYAVGGEAERARELTDQALAAAEDITEEGDRELLLGDLETIPGQPRYW